MDIRKAEERGPSHLGWLDSKHTFSFGSYFDPRYMGFHSLRVINDDEVAPGYGFDTHPHANMEIISYVLEGALEHKDSMGNGSIMRPGDVQRMSAGTGVMHSEYNHSKTEGVHFLQIWFMPGELDIAPGYEQKHFSDAEKAGRFRVVISPDGEDGSVSINQDVKLSAALINGEDVVSYAGSPTRALWVHVAKGTVSMNGTPLKAGDGIGLNQGVTLGFSDGKDAEVLVFDMQPHGKPLKQ